MKILLLEDDLILQESLKEFLELEGFIVDCASNEQEVYDKTYENSYDLYIFDINLQDSEDGISILKALKEADDNTPTIFITALTDISTITKAFENGAQDYIKKPFDPEELIIRIKSRFLKEDNCEIIKFKDLEYNPVTKELKRNKEIIILTKVQKGIFHDLITNLGKVVDIEKLLNNLEHSSTNALRVNLNKIKNRLDIEIKNIRGQGYMIEKV
jgi:DNA-binding response OmpR family regulator